MSFPDSRRHTRFLLVSDDLLAAPCDAMTAENSSPASVPSAPGADKPAIHGEHNVFAEPWHRRAFVLLCLAEVALILATWPVWLGASPVRWISVLPPLLADCPRWVDLVLTIVLMVGCGRLASAGEQPQLLWKLIVVVIAAVMPLLNVARFQPWHWLFLLLMVQLLLFRGAALRRWNQLTLASLYVFAAMSRFDPAFPADAGMPTTLLRTLLQLGGLQDVLRDPHTARLLVGGLNGMELLVGVCLLIPRWHRVGVVLAVLVHAALLTALGPWGLGHSWGVLIWNVLLLLAVPMLFHRPRRATPVDQSAAAVDGQPSDERGADGQPLGWRRSNWRQALSAVLILVVPASALLGLADNWLGWQVYSPRTDRVWLRVSRAAVKQLPRSVQPFVGNPPPLSDLYPVRIDRWVNAVTGAPIYPEDRYQLRLVRDVIRDLDDGTFEIGISTARSPAWWHRQERTVKTHRDLSRAIDGFWVPSVRR